MALDGRGETVAWVRWSRSRERGIGRRLTGLALAEEWADREGLRAVLDAFDRRTPDEGPLTDVPALIPQVPDRAKRAVFRSRGYEAAVRTDLVFPRRAPLPTIHRGQQPPGIVRTLRHADLPAVARLLRAAYADDPRERAMFAEYRDPARDARYGARDIMTGGLGRWLSSASFGREVRGRLVGATLANHLGGPLVSQVMTDPRYRGRGVASDLLARTLAALRRTERAVPRLVVTEQNTPAFRLYRKLGFVPRPGVRGEVWISRRAIDRARRAP